MSMLYIVSGVLFLYGFSNEEESLLTVSALFAIAGALAN